MYGKIFKQMYKGTLAMVGPWEALVTFQQMIVLADIDGVVDMTADAISRETTIPLEIITKGIAALEQPDPESRSPNEEGRRIVLLSDNRSWGWQIVNYEYYRKLRNEEERRNYHRKYWQEKRSKSATNKASTATQQNSTDSTNSSKQKAEAKEEKRGRASRFPPKTFVVSDDMLEWALSQGLTSKEVSKETERFMDYERTRPLKDWHRAWQNWIRKAQEFNNEKAKHSDSFDDRLARVRSRAGLS